MIKLIRNYTNFLLVISGLFLTSGLLYLWQVLGVAVLVIPMVMVILIQLKIYLNQIKNNHDQLAADKTLLKEQDAHLQQLRDHFSRMQEQYSLIPKQVSQLHEIEVKRNNMDQRLVQQIASVRAAVVERDEKQASNLRVLRQMLTGLAKGRVNEYRQIEALFYLSQKIKPRLFLPPTRGWSVSPDFINIMITKIKARKPKVIVELGSGVSTLIASYILQAYHIPGKILSLDHLKKYADATQKNIISHELDHIATAIYAPLEAADFNGNQHLWYHLDAFKDIKTIDMLIVDGPPGKTQKLARYPALPVLYERLGKNAVILLDDASREDEQEMLQMWEKEYKDLMIECFQTEKGTAVIHIDNSDG